MVSIGWKPSPGTASRVYIQGRSLSMYLCMLNGKASFVYEHQYFCRRSVRGVCRINYWCSYRNEPFPLSTAHIQRNVPLYILVKPSPGMVSTNGFYGVETVPGDSFTSIYTGMLLKHVLLYERCLTEKPHSCMSNSSFFFVGLWVVGVR